MISPLDCQVQQVLEGVDLFNHRSRPHMGASSGDVSLHVDSPHIGHTHISKEVSQVAFHDSSRPIKCFCGGPGPSGDEDTEERVLQNSLCPAARNQARGLFLLSGARRSEVACLSEGVGALQLALSSSALGIIETDVVAAVPYKNTISVSLLTLCHRRSPEPGLGLRSSAGL